MAEQSSARQPIGNCSAAWLSEARRVPPVASIGLMSWSETGVCTADQHTGQNTTNVQNLMLPNRL